MIELNDEPGDRVAYRLMRMMSLVRTREYARGVADAGELAQLQNAASPHSGADLYNYACVFGLAASSARNDARIEPAERKRRADQYVTLAIDWLSKAAAAGFFRRLQAPGSCPPGRRPRAGA